MSCSIGSVHNPISKETSIWERKSRLINIEGELLRVVNVDEVKRKNVPCLLYNEEYKTRKEKLMNAIY